MNTRLARLVGIATAALLASSTQADADTTALIGSISGRLIDARDGMPLAGTDDPLTGRSTVLERCEARCRFVDVGEIDAEGRFNFEGPSGELLAGAYRVVTYAAGYEGWQGKVSDVFEVGAGANYDLGDILLEPNRIQFVSVSLCDAIPIEGGLCAFSAVVRNRSDQPFRGGTWATILYALREGDVNHPVQVGAGGTSNPRPARVTIGPDEAQVLSLGFRIPRDWMALDDGSACIAIELGESPRPVFHPVESTDLGCIVRDARGFSIRGRHH